MKEMVRCSRGVYLKKLEEMKGVSVQQISKGERGAVDMGRDTRVAAGVDLKAILVAKCV